MDKHNLIRTQAYVNGQWVHANSRKTFDVTNPANGELIASVTGMDRNDVRKAIDAANSAWPAYRDLTAGERAALLKKWHTLILEHKEALARLMTMECGKVLQESLGEVAYVLAPFGGIKESGTGREGSKYGMDYFMEIKYLCFGGIS